MITPGGEVEFVNRMLVESLSLRLRCRLVPHLQVCLAILIKDYLMHLVAGSPRF